VSLSAILSTVTEALPGRSDSRSLSRSSLLAGRVLYYSALLVGFAILVVPILLVVAVSFNPTQAQAFPPTGFSLRWYGEFLNSSFFRAFFAVSLPIALVVGLVSTVLGLMASYIVARRDVPFENEVVLYFLMPLVVPPAIIGLALLLVFGLQPLSFIPPFVELTAAHVVITIPYTFLTSMTALYSVDEELEQAARNLGATKFQSFRKVTLPLIRSGVISGFLLAFILSFTDSTVALFLSGGNTITLPVEMFLFLQYDSSPLIAATATVQIFLVLVLVVLIGRLVGFKAVTADL
jgi:putative spermidine/putrescine transport system permease protein